jgi:histidinol-phosphate aminotransferase
MPLRPKRWLAGLQTSPHGGIDYAELKELDIDPDEVLDFSVSTNPFLPPPGIREMLRDIPLERYPDSQATALRQRLAVSLEVKPENILAGSGTTELIRLIALAYFRRGDPILILEPTYGEYEVAARIAGARPLKLRAPERNGFVHDIADVVALIRKRRPRAVFFCNPNNPTGKYRPRADIERVLAAMDDNLLVLDEAYVAFVTKSWSPFVLTAKGSVIVLRSMTKDYGLPGLRLGYAVARREIIDTLKAIIPPWNVNSVAQAVGLAVLEQDEYLQQSMVKVRQAKRFLADGLAGLGFQVLPSDAHHFLVKVGNAPACRRALLRYSVLVRDCTSFGLTEYVRVAPRPLPECEKLINAMKKILNSGVSRTF